MDRFEISELRSYYGALLTDRQNEMLRLHYDEDISYGELSELFKVSRQAALDSVKRGSEALCNLEDTLGMLRRTKDAEALLQNALSHLSSGDCSAAETDIRGALEALEE